MSKSVISVSSRMLACILFLLPILVLAADDIPVASEIWKANFKKDVEWQQLTDAGYLIVCLQRRSLRDQPPKPARQLGSMPGGERDSPRFLRTDSRNSIRSRNEESRRSRDDADPASFHRM